MEKEPNLFWQLQNTSLFWLKERPALYEAQINNPLSLIGLLENELGELREVLKKDENGVLGEVADVANYTAQLIYVIQKMYGIKDEDILGESIYKYTIRNQARYPKDDYQVGDPHKTKQLHKALQANREKLYGDDLLGAMIEDESGIY